MGRIIALDYGLKRTGLAASDPEKIIASPLETVPTEQLMDWLKAYLKAEPVERIVVGMPMKPDQSDTHASQPVRKFIIRLNDEFPQIPVSTEDERFTSKIAQQTMILGGMKKKDRQKKENTDKISAVIILQSYMNRISRQTDH